MQVSDAPGERAEWWHSRRHRELVEADVSVGVAVGVACCCEMGVIASVSVECEYDDACDDVVSESSQAISTVWESTEWHDPERD